MGGYLNWELAPPHIHEDFRIVMDAEALLAAKQKADQEAAQRGR